MRLLNLILAGLSLTSVVSAQDPLAKEAVVSRVTSGFELLKKLYWSPALNIWLDRPGDDLRAHYEGRRNPPWWSSANTIEVMIDFMNVTGRIDYDESIKALYDLSLIHI